jgi:hypothetical protein
MPGLVPGIHVLFDADDVDGRESGGKTRFALSPAMTNNMEGQDA